MPGVLDQFLCAMRGRFEMELKADYVASDLKSLVLACGTANNSNGISGKSNVSPCQ